MKIPNQKLIELQNDYRILQRKYKLLQNKNIKYIEAEEVNCNESEEEEGIYDLIANIRNKTNKRREWFEDFEKRWTKIQKLEEDFITNKK